MTRDERVITSAPANDARHEQDMTGEEGGGVKTTANGGFIILITVSLARSECKKC